MSGEQIFDRGLPAVTRTPPWHDAAERGEWLEAAKLAALDQRAASTFALTAATIALVEQLARRIPGTPL